MAAMSELFDIRATPMRIGSVRLLVRDLDAVASFYCSVLGLTQLASGNGHITLGTDTVPLLELAAERALAPNDRRQAGLFHTAFLMPTRADLACCLSHVIKAGVPLQGASDHIVSEAIYLADPEGNGIEVYADRPVSRWQGPDGKIRISTDPLDTQSLLKAAGRAQWAGFPQAGMIGHVHLQVGDTVEADRFYQGVLGLDIAAQYSGASFYGSGGYHHQLAANVWNSRHAKMRPEGMSGLAGVRIIVRETIELAGIAKRAESAGIEIGNSDEGVTLHDPWGTAIILGT